MPDVSMLVAQSQRKNTYAESTIKHSIILERRRIHEEARYKIRVQARLDRVRPSLVDRPSAERAVLARECRHEHFPVVQQLVRVRGVVLDVLTNDWCVGCGSARERRHVEGEEELEGAVQTPRGGVRVVDLHRFPAIAPDVEREGVDTFGRGEGDVCQRSLSVMHLASERTVLTVCPGRLSVVVSVTDDVVCKDQLCGRRLSGSRGSGAT